jgi:hypothetical protein
MTNDIFQKFASHIRGATTLTAIERSQLADAINASAPHMAINDLKALNKGLTELIAADSAKRSKKALRLQRLQAAMADQDDDKPGIDAIVQRTRGELSRLGYKDINEISAAGIDPHELHKKAKAAGWDTVRTIALKTNCAMIGIIE